MADPTTLPRMVLIYNSPRLTSKGDTQDWSLKFSLSGVGLESSSDAEATALDLAQPGILLSDTYSYYKAWRYYPIGTNVALYSGDYDSSVYPCTAAGWASYTDLKQQQTEVCARLYAATGDRSSTGKPTYLSKSIHYVSGAQGATGIVAGTFYGNPLETWDSGSGPDSLVPVSPTTGAIPPAPWALRPELYTRQMRRTR